MGAQRGTGRWTRRVARQLAPSSGQTGLTLIELIVAFSLMLILSTMAVPVARVKVQREKERRLRSALTEIRVAIDRYKDMADKGRLGQLDPNNHGYPTSLEELVEGVEVGPLAGGMPTGGMASGMPGIGLEPSRSLGARPNPMGGIGSRRPTGSQVGSGAFGSDRSQQGGFGSLPEGSAGDGRRRATCHSLLAVDSGGPDDWKERMGAPLGVGPSRGAELERPQRV